MSFAKKYSNPRSVMGGIVGLNKGKTSMKSKSRVSGNLSSYSNSMASDYSRNNGSGVKMLKGGSISGGDSSVDMASVNLDLLSCDNSKSSE